MYTNRCPPDCVVVVAQVFQELKGIVGYFWAAGIHPAEQSANTLTVHTHAHTQGGGREQLVRICSVLTLRRDRELAGVQGRQAEQTLINTIYFLHKQIVQDG